MYSIVVRQSSTLQSSSPYISRTYLAPYGVSMLLLAIHIPCAVIYISVAIR